MALIHTCYRVTDIDRSVAFYEALGFEEVGRLPIRDEAINVFMNQPGDGDMPRLELTYNFGVDSYELGTAYGHIAITSEDLDATLARLAEQGIEPEKPPYTVREGGNRLCFVRDPDGYRVELLEQAGNSAPRSTSPVRPPRASRFRQRSSRPSERARSRRSASRSVVTPTAAQSPSAGSDTCSGSARRTERAPESPPATRSMSKSSSIPSPAR